jgi:AcrR family transcriptional regulator
MNPPRRRMTHKTGSRGVTPEEIAVMRMLREQGWSLKRIAARHGLTHPAVYYHVGKKKVA